MKNWSGVSMAPLEADARRRDGTRAHQVRLAVRAPSKAAARRALASRYLDPGRSYFDNHWSVTGNAETIEALDEVDEGTILVAALDGPGTVVGGTKGWAVLPRRDR